ncbi:MAG: glycosyltransferase family 2 protein [Elusimicrobia bacterium]|nr:glycosyltransferase family 2 protein [Elusimicrobiota bacterium]
MRFSIVIPAYNEEEAVTGILKRSLAASASIRAGGLGVDEVEVILVSDGSSDRTEELARAVSGVRVIGYPKNRGYGAAIKTGFSESKGEIVGFIDADGTCDPEFFADLIRLMQKEKLDVALGSRMHDKSEMPAVRRLGNRIFRTLVNAFASASVNDVASGMRILRRDALPRVYPLPDGLNFTPAMSVRAVMDHRLRIGEIPMPYKERVGRSKLSVIKDGFRFLGVIVETAVTFRPFLFFGSAAAALSALSFLGLCFPCGGPAAPLGFYLRYGHVEDWMIFRLILITVFLGLAAFLFALGAVSRALVGIINQEPEDRSFWAKAAFEGWFVWIGLASGIFSILLNRGILAGYWRTGHIAFERQAWVFPLVGSLFALVGAEFVAFGLISRIARLLRERESFRAETAARP